jgi:hypothetical protein
MRRAIVIAWVLALASLGVAQESPPLPPCDNACLVASMDRLQVTLARHNELLSEQNRLSELIANPPPPPPLTKRERTMQVVRTLGQFSLVALPIVIKTIQQQTIVKAK